MRAKFIYEKFTEEGDPINDMGIGGYSFETLRPGAIFKAKRLGIAVTRNRSGHFASWTYGIKLHPENNLIITHIINFSEGYKRIYFYKVYTNEDTENVKNNIKLKKDVLSLDGIFCNMIVSKRMFNNRFEIIERGF